MKIIIKVFIILAMAQAMCFAEIGSKEEPMDAQTLAEMCQNHKQEMIAKHEHHRLFVRGIVTKICNPVWHTPWQPIAFITLGTTPKTIVEVTGVGYENEITFYGLCIPYGVQLAHTKIAENTLSIMPHGKGTWQPMVAVGDTVLVECLIKAAPVGGVYLAESAVRKGTPPSDPYMWGHKREMKPW